MDIISCILLPISLILSVSSLVLTHTKTRRNNQKNKYENSSLDLNSIIKLKKSIKDEETSNHVFDPKNDYYSKIKTGAKKLNQYKTDNKTLINDIYKAG